MDSFKESIYASQAQGKRNLDTHRHLDCLGQLLLPCKAGNC